MLMAVPSSAHWVVSLHGGAGCINGKRRRVGRDVLMVQDVIGLGEEFGAEVLLVCIEGAGVARIELIDIRSATRVPADVKRAATGGGIAVQHLAGSVIELVARGECTEDGELISVGEKIPELVI